MIARAINNLLRGGAWLGGTVFLFYSMYRYGWRWLWLRRRLPLIDGEYCLTQAIEARKKQWHHRAGGYFKLVGRVKCLAQLPLRSAVDGAECVYTRTRSVDDSSTVQLQQLSSPSSPLVYSEEKATIDRYYGGGDSGRRLSKQQNSRHNPPPPPSPLATSSWFEQNIVSIKRSVNSVRGIDWVLELPSDGFPLPVSQQESAEMILEPAVERFQPPAVGFSGGRLVEERLLVDQMVFIMAYVKQHTSAISRQQQHYHHDHHHHHPQPPLFGNTHPSVSKFNYRVQKPLMQWYLITTMSEEELSRWLGCRWLAGSAIGIALYVLATAMRPR